MLLRAGPVAALARDEAQVVVALGHREALRRPPLADGEGPAEEVLQGRRVAAPHGEAAAGVQCRRQGETIRRRLLPQGDEALEEVVRPRLLVLRAISPRLLEQGGGLGPHVPGPAGLFEDSEGDLVGLLPAAGAAQFVGDAQAQPEAGGCVSREPPGQVPPPRETRRPRGFLRRIQEALPPGPLREGRAREVGPHAEAPRTRRKGHHPPSAVPFQRERDGSARGLFALDLIDVEGSIESPGGPIRVGRRLGQTRPGEEQITLVDHGPLSRRALSHRHHHHTGGDGAQR